ncbi:FAD-binding domain-containing protein [Viridibacterium curvum]|uniref:Cryptochrome/DNA photolyase FAD-binding domain-containing protein n=1 Tax=Viridibacterium curvum TaxID=1101404 RepID=A0ABP9QRD2_9RHOO
MAEDFAPTLAAAHARIAAVQPAAYARTRNAIDGAVTGLSPYITHGFVTLAEVLAGVAARHALDVQHKFVFELGWRAYFRHVWQHRGEGIFQSLHAGPLPDAAYSRSLPDDIRHGCTGVPVIDTAVRSLYATGMLHNHARMWLASYVVHLRKVHWRVGADWLYGHLLDGDLASNHLSWQWVAGTGSCKPYLFNAENVARYAPPAWHSAGSVIDTTYAQLEEWARDPAFRAQGSATTPAVTEPPLLAHPPGDAGLSAPDAARVKHRDVWLVHPWNLGKLPADLPPDVCVIGLVLTDFHRAWPWSERRWRFVSTRMAELAECCWVGDAQAIATALHSARSVWSVAEPHLSPWLSQLATCVPEAPLFPTIDRRCDAFAQWWKRAAPGLDIGAAQEAKQ